MHMEFLIIACLKVVILVKLSFCQLNFFGDDGSFTGCWQGNIIPYKIQPGFFLEYQGVLLAEARDFVNHIKWNLWILHNATCLRWVDETEATFEVTESVWIVFGKLCMMKVHKLNETRTVYEVQLNEYCFKGRWIMHKILNALGFYMEHQRADRDCYVRIADKALDDELFQIRPYSPGKWLEKFPYDRYSVMHFHRGSRMQARTERWYHLWQPLGNYEGELTQLDIWKLLYRFCNYPHFCDIDPKYCQEMDAFEKGCA